MEELFGIRLAGLRVVGIVILLISSNALIDVHAQGGEEDYYYYFKNDKIQLELNTEYLYITTPNIEHLSSSKITALTNKEKSVVSGVNTLDQTLNRIPNEVNTVKEFYWKEIAFNRAKPKGAYEELLTSFKSSSNPVIASPYFNDPSGKKIAVTNYFFVKLKKDSDIKILKNFVSQHKLELVGQNKFMPLWYVVSVTSSSRHSLDMSNVFYESGLFDQSHPDFIFSTEAAYSSDSRSNAPLSNDPNFIDQWHLSKINAPSAWGITSGSGIKIAVLDEGIELNHPDLVNNLSPLSFDATNGTSPSAVSGPHGTACAGIAVSTSNNGLGGSGVAPESELMSISIVFNISSLMKFADGINWAWQNGADVISNSWIAGATPVGVIEDAIFNANTQGRGGLGTVVVFATGNFNAGVNYPASTSQNILAVGATSPCDERKNPNSCDGETNWGSNFGVTLDVVAPGVLMSTTDLQGDVQNPVNCFGPGDYNPNFDCPSNIDYPNYNYTKFFNGTSSATPVVAGVAALVLAANPALSAAQAIDVVEQSSQKVGAYSYNSVSDRPNGTWNDEMGYGQVDAYQAVLLASQVSSGQINLITQVCANPIVVGNNLTANYTIANLGSSPSGSFTVQWYIYPYTGGSPFVFSSQNQVGSIPGNSSYASSRSFDLSLEMGQLSLPDGDYVLAMWIDYNDQVIENNEDDNFCISSVPFSYVATNQSNVNLTHDSNCIVPQLNGPQDLTAFYTLENTGNTPSGSFVIQWYIYPFGGGAPLEFGSTQDVIANIPANSTYNGFRVFDFAVEMSQLNLPAGDYVLAMYIDNNLQVVETNETDNFCISSLPFNYSGPSQVDVNLTMSTNCVSTQVDSNNGLTATYSIENTGLGASGAFDLQWYVYRFSGGDPYLFGTQDQLSGIGGNSTVNGSRFFDLNLEMSALDLPSDDYVLAVWVDNNSAVNETNETDNFCISSIPFTYSALADCGYDTYLHGDWNGSFTIKAPTYIIAPSAGQVCNVPGPLGDLNLESGDYIELRAGFSVESGGQLHAQIVPCVQSILQEEDKVQFISIDGKHIVKDY